jgi:hypothetical protein
MAVNVWRQTSWLVVALLLAACGGMGESRSGDTSARLSQTVSASSVLTGVITVNFPDQWVARATRGEVHLGNSQAALDTAGDPQSGQIGGTVIAYPLPLLPSHLGIQSATTPTQVLQQFVRGLNVELAERQANFGLPETFSVGERPAAIAQGTITQPGQAVNAYVATVDAGEAYVVVLLVAVGGSTDDQLSITRGIAESVIYEPPA